MRVIHKDIYVNSRTDRVRVYALSDMHLGNALCDEKKLVRVINAIADDPTAYWVSLGDICEWIGRHDKRHLEESLAPWIWGKHGLLNTQRDYAIDMLAPIKGKCLGLIEGNHEAFIRDKLEYDVHNDFVRYFKQNVDEDKMDLGNRGFLVLHFKLGEGKKPRSIPVNIFMRHYNSTGRQAGSHALSLERMTQDKVFDVALAGHGHRLMKIGPEIVQQPHPRQNRMIHRVVQAAECGSFLRSSDEEGKLDSYAGKADLKALSTGFVMIDIHPHLTSGVHIEVRTMEDVWW